MWIDKVAVSMYRFCSFWGIRKGFGSHRSKCSFLVSTNLTLPITVAVAQSVSMKIFLHERQDGSRDSVINVKSCCCIPCRVFRGSVNEPRRVDVKIHSVLFCSNRPKDKTKTKNSKTSWKNRTTLHQTWKSTCYMLYSNRAAQLERWWCLIACCSDEINWYTKWTVCFHFSRLQLVRKRCILQREWTLSY